MTVVEPNNSGAISPIGAGVGAAAGGLLGGLMGLGVPIDRRDSTT
ncbi:hypothetical protein [aff. Roholtiella sp. LEGE 12411]|nr:hypothetical protein [aff. Roholtiella sp. LEGE 12411]